MVRGKKGVEALVNIIIVMFVLIGLGAVLLNGSGTKNIVVNIGEKNVELLKTYVEAEKIRDFTNQAARFAALKAASDSGAKAGSSCFTSVTNFQKNFQTEFDRHFILSPVSTDTLTVKQLPSYDIISSIKATEIEVTGTTDSKIILAGSGFNYTAGAYFKQKIDCAEFGQFEEAHV